MSNRSSTIPPQDHDLATLIREKKDKENKEKNAAELQRQRDLVKKELWPFLLENGRSITDAKKLLSNTSAALTLAYQQKMEEEKNRLSGSTLDELDIDERLERDKKYEAERSVLRRLRGERVGTAAAIVEGLEIAIIGKEAEEHSTRPLSELNIGL